MNTEKSYVVKSGDTLGKIAQVNQTSVMELMQLNHIKHPDKISVGQKIQLPKPPSSSQIKDDHDSSEHESDWGSLVLQFVDAINRPIKDLKVKIEAFGSFFETKTNEKGVVESLAVKKGEPVKVHVARAQGGTKQVATIKPDNSAQHARIISPKTSTSTNLRPHEGPPGPPTAKPKPPGEQENTRSPAGNPVHEIALECPNPQNLKLVANFKYRDIVIAAAKRANLVPQSVAAIMNAEAAKIPQRFITKPVIDFKTGKPKLDKNGKPRVEKSVDPTWQEGEWDARSASPLSSARGMTQFLDGSWIDQACAEGTYLNTKAKKEGWLTKTTVEIVQKGKKTGSKTVNSFKLADGTLITGSATRSLARVLSGKPYLTGRATASDGNLQALLDLRFEPEYAIHTAVDYGIQNMAGLQAAGYAVDGLNDADKAKIIYLCHHLGIGDAKLFINNAMSATRAQYLLEQQVKVARAKALAKRDNDKYDYLDAHRTWLDQFINRMIVLKGFFCTSNAQAEPRTLFAICDAIKKKG